MSYILSWFALIGGIWALFERAETVASNETKAAISRWLRNLALPDTDQWSATFVAIFDRIFGERHFSVRCFFASSIASAVSVAVVTLLWASIYSELVAEIFSGAFSGRAFLALLFVAAIVNLIPDYLSLLQTRYILQLITKTRSGVVILGLLVLDLLLTSILAIGVALLFFLSMNRGLYGSLYLIKEGFLLKPQWFLALGQRSFSIGIFIYSTYLTSLWLWLYILTGTLIKARPRSIATVTAFLDVEHKPLRSLGFVVVLMVTCAYLLGLAPSFLMRDQVYDAYWRPAIVGTWHGEEPFMKLETTYHSEGSFHQTLTRTLPSEKMMTVVVKGIWTIEDNMLVMTALESAPPGIEKGAKSIDKIASITDQKMVLIGADGSRHERFKRSQE